jgi:hypothetical protein
MIKTASLPILTDTPPLAPARLQLNPFLHLGEDRVYNPLTDRLLLRGELGYDGLRSILTSGFPLDLLAPGDRAELARQGWLMPAETEPAREFLLKHVSLEAHTVCNQSCYFCPVAIAPREDYFMPTELYERILGELAAWRDTIEGVFMINYNEPTADKRFVDQVRAIKAVGLPPAINISTLDRERYQKERGGDHLAGVLRNLDYAKDKPLAPQMDMAVLGTGNDDHKRDFEEISRRFAGSRFQVKYYEVMDRAGYLQIGHRPAAAAQSQRLCGCDNVGSRPLQHIHITPQGKCVLCCEDYDAKYVVGDLTRQSVQEVLTGPALALMRRWVYGLEESPKDFICHGCTFALTRPA